MVIGKKFPANELLNCSWSLYVCGVLFDWAMDPK